MVNRQVQLDGPRLPPTSGEPARQLVILLHGYGADGEDLIGIAPYMARLVPEAAFVSPHAPERCAMQPMGYQWWGIDTFSREERLAGAERAAPSARRRYWTPSSMLSWRNWGWMKANSRSSDSAKAR